MGPVTLPAFSATLPRPTPRETSVIEGMATVAAPAAICRRAFLREIHIGYCTTRLTVVECDWPPLVPVIVTTVVPTCRLFLVSIVSVEVPELTTDVGVNLTL